MYMCDMACGAACRQEAAAPAVAAASSAAGGGGWAQGRCLLSACVPLTTSRQ